MNITDVQIRRIFERRMLKATLTIVIDHDFAVHDIKILMNDSGRLFIAMPSRQNKKHGGFCDVTHPIGSKAREELEKQILLEYYKQLDNEEMSEIIINADGYF